MKRIPHVALLVETSKAFGRGILAGIGRYTLRHGPWATWIEEYSLDDPVPHWLKKWKGDGIIARTRSRQTMRQIAKSGLPLVQLGEEFLGDLPRVQPDERENVVLAVDHLLERQFRNFCFVGVRDAVWSKLRRNAFVEYVRGKGHSISIVELEIRPGHGSDWEEERAKLAHWIHSLPKPLGVVACYDVVGRALLNVCREKGVAVPDEVGVVGIDNDQVLCEVSDPPLSSVNQGQEKIGYEAAAMLHRLMRGEDPKSPQVLAPVGVVARLSSDTMALEDREVAAALKYIRTHACSGIRVEDVARETALTRRTLERKFQLLIERTINNEIMRVRLTRVKQLLEDTDWSMEKIAGQCGFASNSYLGVVFKRETGQSPGDYRWKMQRNPK